MPRKDHSDPPCAHGASVADLGEIEESQRAPNIRVSGLSRRYGVSVIQRLLLWSGLIRRDPARASVTAEDRSLLRTTPRSYSKSSKEKPGTTVDVNGGWLLS